MSFLIAKVFPTHYTGRLCTFLLQSLQVELAFASTFTNQCDDEVCRPFSTRLQVVDRIEKESGIKLRDGYKTVENARFRTLFTLAEFLVFIDRRKYSDKRLAEVPPCPLAISFQLARLARAQIHTQVAR